jgi:7-keto-8-aminopelargonate synthetase-like enzyme
VLDVERQAARFFGTESAFYFASGFAGMEILLSFLRRWCDALFVDECSHYAVHEAVRHSGLPVGTFGHCDVDALRAALAESTTSRSRPAVLTDGVFSALGHIAPLAGYRDVLRGFGFSASMLLVDDAHGIGVLGPMGRGTLEHAGLWDEAERCQEPFSAESLFDRLPSPIEWEREASERVPDTFSPGIFFCGTLSKALGGFGGILPGSQAWIERVKRQSPYYPGASPPPTPAAAATARALELVMADPGIRARLRANVSLVKSGLGRLGLPVDDTPVPIVCLEIGSGENMRRIQEELMRRGIAVAYMSAYSGLGPEGALRLAVFATHTEAMIGQLLDALARLV